MNDVIEKQVLPNAPLARVWSAVTEADQFGAWFQVRLEGPFRLGEWSLGRITTPGYEHMRWKAMVVAFQPMSLFAFEWHPNPVDPERDYSDEPMTRVAFRLEAVGGQTRLVITESGFKALPPHRRDQAFPRNEAGWTQQVRNIQAHVES